LDEIFGTHHAGVAREVRLALAGELDLSTVDRPRQHVTQELAGEPPPRPLVIDLAETTCCDSTGIGALIEAHDGAANRGTHLSVINLSGLTRTVMQVTGVLTVLVPAADVDQPR
jgi:anti-sigma B factor antagonist